MKTHSKTILLFFLFLIPNAAQAQWQQVSTYSNITSLLVSGTNFYEGTLDGFLLLSTDTGKNWKNLGEVLNNNFIVSSMIKVDTSLFTGMRNSTGGGQILITNDNGKTWDSTGDGMMRNTFVSVFVTIGTNLFAGTEGDGVFLSTDSGKSWTAKNNGLSELAVLDRDTVNVSLMVNTLAINGTDMLLGTEGGIFISTDTGKSWTQKNTGLTNTNVDAFAAYGMNIFAGTNDGIFRSTNNGTNWTSENNGLLPAYTFIGSLIAYGSNIFASTSAEIFDGTSGGVFQSTDSGSTWLNIGENLTGDSFGLFLDSGEYLFATSNMGVWRRPLSDFITSAVSASISIENSFTNYPNPLSQSTTINFSSSESGVAEVAIVNLLGSEVARIFSGELSAGSHQFTWDAGTMLPGMYECVVRINGSVQQAPIVLLR